MTAHPTPQEVKAARQAAGLTQEQAAEMVCVKPRQWQRWEATEGGAGVRSAMPPGLWKLFKLLVE